MSKRFYYYNTSYSPSGSGYILDDITSTAAYAVSFTRYLTSSYVGQPVVRLRASSNGNQEFDFTVEELVDGTAIGLCLGGAGIITRIYNQIDGTYFESLIANRQHTMIESGVLITDSNGFPAFNGKSSSPGRYAINPLPYTGGNAAVFNVGKMATYDSIPLLKNRVGAFGIWAGNNSPASTWMILGLGLLTVEGGVPVPFTSGYSNGIDLAGYTDLMAFRDIETVQNMTGLNLTGPQWSNEGLGTLRTQIWSTMLSLGPDQSRQMEQIYFNDFLESERIIIETNQNETYGYF